MEGLDYERDFILSDPSLALYLPFWKKDGASLMSEDRYGHLAAVTGAIWTPEGRVFDGVDDRIVVPASTPTAMANGFTVAFWAKVISISGVHAGFFFSKQVDASNYIRISHIDFGGPTYLMTFVIRVAASNIVGITVSPYTNWDSWCFYVVTMTLNDCKFYKDMTLLGSDTECTMPDLSTADLYIGSDSAGANNLNGIIDNFILINRVLTVPELNNLRDATKWRYY